MSSQASARYSRSWFLIWKAVSVLKLTVRTNLNLAPP
jgi:hypothetical protein